MLSDPQKRSAYDRSGHAGSTSAWAAARARGFGGFAGGLRRHLRRHLRWRRRWPPGGGRVYRGSGPVLRDGDHARGGRARQGDADPHPELGDLRDLPRQRRQARHQRQDLHHLQRRRQRAHAPGLLQHPADRPQCRGSGKIIPEPCTVCNGQGKTKKTKTLEVKIPAGIAEGMRIRSAGNGELGTKWRAAGRLYIELRVKPHEIFERDGDDLHRSVPVSMTTAALGAASRCRRWPARPEIDLPESTQNGKTFRLRGKGIKGAPRATPATRNCHISIETPVRITEHQRKLLKEPDESFRKVGDRHSPNAKSWTDRVKDIFGSPRRPGPRAP